MKTVGILTYHYADNFGAVLQAYALQKAFNSFDECEATLIDYIPNGFVYESRWSNAVEKLKFYKKRDMFEEFLRKNCILSNRCNYVFDGKFDIYCVGSDQVWNTTNLDGNYFLSSISDETEKVSFATSIALKNDSKYFKKDYFKEKLKGFKYISVRETENADALSTILKKQCERQCDPTILLDNDDWGKLEEKIEIKDKYILFFWLMNDDDVFRGIEFVNRLSRIFDLPVLHSLYGKYCRFINNSLGTMFYCSPGSFLSYIKNAEYVVTNSYHATLFAMRYKRIFNLFIVDSMKTRIETILELYNVDMCVVEKGTNTYKTPQIDFDYIEGIMESEKKRGFAYIDKLLKG